MNTIQKNSGGVYTYKQFDVRVGGWTAVKPGDITDRVP